MRRRATFCAIGLTLTLGSIAGVGCQVGVPRPLTQAQTVAVETREVQGTVDEAFTAATGALLDAGYTIRMSDRDAGLLTGLKLQDNVGRMVGTATTVTIRNIIYMTAAAMAGSAQAPIEDYPDTESTLAVCLLIERVSAARSQVRVRTYVDGLPVVEKKAVDTIWVGMQRQDLRAQPVAAPPGSPTAAAAPQAVPPPVMPTAPKPDAPARAAPKPTTGRGITDPAPPR